MVVLMLISALVFSLIMGKVSQRLINNLEKLSRIFGIGHYASIVVLIAAATTLPELTVGVTSALRGMPLLGLGSALGSNIVNLSLILGLAAIFGNGLHFNKPKQVKEDLAILGLAFLPYFWLLDGKINRVEGVISIIVYGLYVRFILKQDRVAGKIFERDVPNFSFKLLIETLGLMAVIIVSAMGIIRLAADISSGMAIPIMFIGLFVISVGTAIPEIIFHIKSAKEHQVSLSLGNIIGACATNSTLVIGVSALISPIVIESTYMGLLPGLEFLFISLLAVNFIMSKHRLDRLEGAVMVGVFIYYSVLQLIL